MGKPRRQHVLVGKHRRATLAKLTDQASHLEREEGLHVIAVGSAGVGRAGFAAWHLSRNAVDRDDGGRAATYGSPGQALRALADELDAECLRRGWHAELFR